MFEIAPSPLRDVERRAIKPRPSKDPENPSGGHRIPPLRINEAGDDRTLVCVELDDANQSLRQAIQAGESPQRFLDGVLRYIPKRDRANLFVRPVNDIRVALSDRVLG